LGFEKVGRCVLGLHWLQKPLGALQSQRVLGSKHFF